jgi:hypothetical protein
VRFFQIRSRGFNSLHLLLLYYHGGYTYSMGFKQWLEMSSLRDTLKQVPQNPNWHSEGDVYAHTRLVRQALPTAVQMFEKVRSDTNSPFAQLTPVDAADTKILQIAAWLHDLGKASATTYNTPDKTQTPLAAFQGHSVSQLLDPNFQQGKGKWQSIGHEDPQHYIPVLQQLGRPWQNMIEKLSPQDKDCLFFVVDKHMDLQSSMRSALRKQMIQNGKFLPDRKNKLWIVFKLMDVMGRGNGTDIASGEEALQKILDAAKVNNPTPRARPQTAEELRQSLVQKGLSPETIQDILSKANVH